MEGFDLGICRCCVGSREGRKEPGAVGGRQPEVPNRRGIIQEGNEKNWKKIIH